MSPNKANGLGGWTLRDEAKFINNIGNFAQAQPSTPKTVEALLYKYRNALTTKRHAATFSFSKAEALILIDRRLEEVRAALPKPNPQAL